MQAVLATLSVLTLLSLLRCSIRQTDRMQNETKDENAFFYSINCFTAISIIIFISRPVFAQNQDWLYWMFMLFYV